jgi:KAP family P-loop domain
VADGVTRFCAIVALGTGVAFTIGLLFPLFQDDEILLWSYAKHSTPNHSLALAVVIVAALLIVIALSMQKLWRSLRLGLVLFSLSTWFLVVVIFWLLIFTRHPLVATTVIIGAAIGALSIDLLRKTVNDSPPSFEGGETDLPISEEGQDLLGRGDAVESLIFKIVYERPAIIAITAPYGRGKTSFVNLALGKVRKLGDADRPIIVKYSPWLAADPNSLVLSLLNSIITEMQKSFFIPGLREDASGYSRTLLTAIPKFELLKHFLTEPSQEEQVNRLARRISATQRRILIVLDDLDRLQSGELETLFKVLRGSEAFVNVTFVCCFDKAELAKILEVSRPHQDRQLFIEKFFQSTFPLPEIDTSHLGAFFRQEIEAILRKYHLPSPELEKTMEDFWSKGGHYYFQTLRRIKLFVSKINHSLAQIGPEVNLKDFIWLELLRDVAPPIYEAIYRDREYFWDGDLAFETRFIGTNLSSDETRAKKQRADYYEGLSKEPLENQTLVHNALAELFPSFAEYEGRPRRGQSYDSQKAEEGRRIFHPRCFRQYFILKVPSELFGRKEFDAFVNSINSSSEDSTKQKFNEVFESIVGEDFKRWHFVDRIDNAFDTFQLPSARGICRGLMQQSKVWQSDSFEFIDAARCVKKVLGRLPDDSDKQRFLVQVVSESTSTLCALLLVEMLEREAKEQLPADLLSVHEALKEKMRLHYLVGDAPSVFQEFHTDSGRIEPIQLLMAWRRLGPDAELDQQKYLVHLFVRRPADMKAFLRMMFRVDFMDDYSALKPLIDYTQLASLIDGNIDLLDDSKVEAFRNRYDAER